MPSYPRSAWESLGELLVRRRIELDSRYRNRRTFTSERAVEYRIVNDIELGRRDSDSRRWRIVGPEAGQLQTQ